MKFYACLCWNAALFMVAVFFLSACGSNGGSVNQVQEEQSSSSSIEGYETFDDLPRCTSKKEGKEVYVEEDDAEYVCEDGDWVKAKKPSTVAEYETFDDLPACTSKKEGKEVYVEEDDIDYVCEDGEWVEAEGDSDGKSSASKDKTSSTSAKSSASKDQTSSSSVKPSSSNGGSAVSGDVAKKRIGPVSQYGQLQAGAPSGTGRIYGSCKGVKSGNEVMVQGMSLFWSIGDEGAKYWTSGIVNGLVSKQNIQLIRGAMGIDEDWGNGNYFTDTKKYQDMMDEVVAAAIENDIYVIIDYHSHKANDNTDNAKAFFKRMAQKWGAYDNVIFEIFNEPIKQTWSTIKSYANQVIPVIREYSDNLIVVGTPSYSANPDAAVGSAISDNNVAYTFHFYAGVDEYQHDIDIQGANAEYAMRNGLSVFVTEWGNSGPTGAGSVVSSRSSSWYNWMKSNKLSGANWSVSDKDEAASYFTTSGAWSYSTSGNWVNSNIFAYLPTSYTECDGSSLPSSSASVKPSSSASSSVGEAVDILGGAGLFNENRTSSGWTLNVTNGAAVGKVRGETDDDLNYVLAFWSNGPRVTVYDSYYDEYSTYYPEEYDIQAKHKVALRNGYSYTVRMGLYAYDNDGVASRDIQVSILETTYYDAYAGWIFESPGEYEEFTGTYCHDYPSDSAAEFHIDGGNVVGGFSVVWVVIEEREGCDGVL